MSLALACILVTGTMFTAVHAEDGVTEEQTVNLTNYVVDSVASAEYVDADEINSTSTNECEVKATIGSTFFVIIPKIIVLDKTGESGYTVTVDADLAGTEFISVIPSAKEIGYKLIEEGGKESIDYTVTQLKQIFYANGSVSEFIGATVENRQELMEQEALSVNHPTYTIQNREAAIVDGLVAAPEISAGIWEGVFNFNIAKQTKEVAAIEPATEPVVEP